MDFGREGEVHRIKREGATGLGILITPLRCSLPFLYFSQSVLSAVDDPASLFQCLQLYIGALTDLLAKFS